MAAAAAAAAAEGAARSSSSSSSSSSSRVALRQCLSSSSSSSSRASSSAVLVAPRGAAGEGCTVIGRSTAVLGGQQRRQLHGSSGVRPSCLCLACRCGGDLGMGNARGVDCSINQSIDRSFNHSSWPPLPNQHQKNSHRWSVRRRPRLCVVRARGAAAAATGSGSGGGAASSSRQSRRCRMPVSWEIGLGR